MTRDLRLRPPASPTSPTAGRRRAADAGQLPTAHSETPARNAETAARTLTQERP